VPVDPVTGLPLPSASGAPSATLLPPQPDGPALSTNTPDDMMNPDPGSQPSGDQFQIPLGNIPAPQ